KGQAFSIMGEAGVGKSRLLYEFRKTITNQDITFLEGKCLSYSGGVAYHPIIDILKSNFYIMEGDRDHKVREKVTKGLTIFDLDEAATLPYILELLSVKDSGIDKIPMSPESRQDRIIQALNNIILKGSEIRPLIMAFEDLHWIDKTSEKTINYLLESISGSRILLISSYRPEFIPTWSGRSYHNQVTLNRLSNRESLAMVTYLLGTEDIEKDLEDLILEKTEGIPFFIEEFIKSLKDMGIIEKTGNTFHLTKDKQDLTIPSTIRDVIMARVDSLPDPAKSLLQTGSVIEREFSYELIKKVTNISQDELLSRLSVLKDSELLYERGIYPQTIYIFRHALTREVVYDSILTDKKKKLHLKIADSIEEVYKGNLDEYYEALAGHYIDGESYEKGAEYCKLAGSKAEDAGSLIDAIALGEKRVTCLEKLPQTEDLDKKIIDARTSLGLYYSQMNFQIAAKEAVSPIIDLAIHRNYQRRVSQIYGILGFYSFMVEEDFPTVFKYLEDALQIAEDLNDMLSLYMAMFWLGIALAYAGEFERSLYYWEKVLEINISANSLWGISLNCSCISFGIYSPQGKVDLAYQASEYAMRITEESGDIYSRGVAHTSRGISFYHKRLFDDAKEHLLKGAYFCESINEPVWNALANLFLADTYFDAEEYEKSKESYEKAISIWEHSRLWPSFNNLSRIGFARAKVMNNQKDMNLNELFKCFENSKSKIIEGQMLRYIGEILLNIDNQHMNEAEDWIKRAIEANERNNTRFHLGMSYALYADFFKRKGELPEARQKLNKAIEILRECGADGWVDKAEEELGRIQQKVLIYSVHPAMRYPLK
ncbi:MAG: AAA family ATPase, partial [Thermodesulfobacteriota bacterium]|nr:AAA family ATPase [Thermodesulfobacteriota bacterium]